MKLHLEVAPQEKGKPSLIESAGFQRVRLSTEEGERTPMFSTMTDLNSYLRSVHEQGFESGEKLSNENLAAITAEATEIGIAPDGNTLYDAIVALAPEDPTDLEGVSVVRCNCPEPWLVHAHLRKEQEVVAASVTLSELAIMLDLGIERSGFQRVETGVAMLRAAREMGVAPEKDEVDRRYAAASDEEKRAHRVREQERRQREVFAHLFGLDPSGPEVDELIGRAALPNDEGQQG